MKKYLRLVPFLLIHACGCPGLAQTYVEKQEIDAYNLLKNPGFENGLVGWTRGAGCSTNSPAPLSGSRNGNCTGTGSAETKWEQTVSVAEYRPHVGKTFKASCNITTISSSMQFCGLFNGAETCIPVAESASLSAAGYTEYAVPVSIPADQASSFTAGVRIKTTGSGVFGTRVDNCYLGPWKGVVGLVQPVTIFSAQIDSSGVPAESADFINGNCSYSSNQWTCPFTSGRFGFVPTCTVSTQTSLHRIASVISASTSSIVVQTFDDAGARSQLAFNMICQMRGSDYTNAQATVTSVVGLVPKETVYTAKVDSTGVVTDETGGDWINGNCTNGSPSVCTFTTNFFGSSTPNCGVTAQISSSYMAVVQAVSSLSVSTRTYTDTGTSTPQNRIVWCQRSGTDYDNARKTYDNVPFSPMESGSYTPTLTNTTNISSSTANLFTYVRVGDVVMVHGRPSIQPTAASGTVSELRISLPIEPAANFSSTGRCFGVGGLFRNAAQSPHTGAVASVNGAKLCAYVFNAQTTSDSSNGLSFSYLLK